MAARPDGFYRQEIFLICVTLICAIGFTNCATAGITDIPRVVEKTDALEKTKTRGAGETFKPHIVELPEEIKTNPESNIKTEVPPACLSVLREFIAYLSGNSPNIFYNREAQRKWFASNMQRAAAKHLSVYLKENQKRDLKTFPDNATLIDSRESPSAFSIVGYRWGKGDIEIDVLYRWSEDQIYAGDSRIATYDFVNEWVDEGSVWRIHAISFKESANGFSPADELTVKLWSDSYE